MASEPIHVPGLRHAQGKWVGALTKFGPDDPRTAQFGNLVNQLMSQAMWQVEEGKRRRTLAGESCFVCYFDVDGFRQRARQEPEALYSDYQSLRTYMLPSFFTASASTRGDFIEVEHTEKLLWPYAFSDSWFFASIDDSETSLRQIASAGAGIFMRFFELGLPGRGGIGHGRTWWNQSQQIILGPSIIDAYELGESLDAFGIAVDPKVAESAPEGILTPPIRVRRRSKCESSVDCDRQFARLYASTTSSRWNTTHYRQRFQTMSSQYAASASPRDHVVERYLRSVEIVDAMLEGLPDEPGMD